MKADRRRTAYNSPDDTLQIKTPKGNSRKRSKSPPEVNWKLNDNNEKGTYAKQRKINGIFIKDKEYDSRASTVFQDLTHKKKKKLYKRAESIELKDKVDWVN